MWILGSLWDSLQEQVVTTLGNAKALWDHLKDLFHDKKDARAINLDNELRSIKIRKITVKEYCTKIKSMENRLRNLDCEVSKKNLVIYAVNGLDSRFVTLVEIIRHRKPLPTFETVRNMLLLKESSFNDESGATNTFKSISSSPTVLLASNSSSKGIESLVPLTRLLVLFHGLLRPTLAITQPGWPNTNNRPHPRSLVPSQVPFRIDWPIAHSRPSLFSWPNSSSHRIFGLAISSFDVTTKVISIQLPSRQPLPLLFSLPVLPRGINALVIQETDIQEKKQKRKPKSKQFQAQ
ncbi:hybrid signal transduction histidine kinase M, partial [Tanacetum coccineum]